jgi:hypothetical protein
VICAECLSVDDEFKPTVPFGLGGVKDGQAPAAVADTKASEKAIPRIIANAASFVVDDAIWKKIRARPRETREAGGPLFFVDAHAPSPGTKQRMKMPV